MANAAFMASSNLISVPPFVALSGAKATGSVGDINPLSGTAAIAETSGQLGGLSAAPFSDLLSDAVGQIDALEGQARSAVEGLISGKGVDVHKAMIATEKAEMGFELMLSVRNKALSAYQQILGMQF